MVTILRLSLLGLACLFPLSPLLAEEPAETRPSRTSSRSPGRALDREPSRRTIEDGYLFINGAYVHPPYAVSVVDKQIVVNGFVIAGAETEEQSLWLRSHARQMRMTLENDEAVIHLEGEPLVFWSARLADFLLEDLLTEGPRDRLIDRLRPSLPDDGNRAVWEEWLASYSAPRPLAVRARARLDQRDSTERKNRAEINAEKRLTQLGYPLNILGMLLGVVALGHLLQTRPEPFGETAGIVSAPSPAAVKMVIRSVGFLVALSSLDLIWTVLAWQAGYMKELNPLASRMITDPLALVIFKGGATGLGAGLLILLREYRAAQAASWWMCLVCTVLTFRWLSFNSMFIA